MAATSIARPGPSVSTTAPAAAVLPALPLNLETISRIAGLSALAGAVLAGAGMLYTYSYLSAWGIAPPLVKMDLLSAALRAEGVAYQVLLLVSVFLLARAVLRWNPRPPYLRIGALAATGAVATALSVESFLGGFVGGTIALLGGVGLAFLRVRELVAQRAMLVTAAVVVLLSSYVTGTEIGKATRDDRGWQREVQVVTDVAVGDLPGTPVANGAWRYEGLYLIFRDDRQLYVGVRGRAEAWLVDGGHVLSLGVARPAGELDR